MLVMVMMALVVMAMWMITEEMTAAVVLLWLLIPVSETRAVPCNNSQLLGRVARWEQ